MKHVSETFFADSRSFRRYTKNRRHEELAWGAWSISDTNTFGPEFRFKISLPRPGNFKLDSLQTCYIYHSIQGLVVLPAWGSGLAKQRSLPAHSGKMASGNADDSQSSKTCDTDDIYCLVLQKPLFPDA